MQRAAIVGVFLGLPFALTGCGNSGGNDSGNSDGSVNPCDPITQPVPNPLTGEMQTAIITVDLSHNAHGAGNPECCQYFADGVSNITRTVPAGCDQVSMVIFRVSVNHGGCFNSCSLPRDGYLMTIGGIANGCCGELQTAMEARDLSGVSEKCNVNNTYCLEMWQEIPTSSWSATSSLAATLNQLHLATPVPTVSDAIV